MRVGEGMEREERGVSMNRTWSGARSNSRVLTVERRQRKLGASGEFSALRTPGRLSACRGKRGS